MIQVENTPEITFSSGEEAVAFFSNKEYYDIVVKKSEINVDHDGFKVGSTKYPMTDTFLDNIFSMTKLPRANEKVLPTENVVTDINTILHGASLEDEHVVRFEHGKAYSIMPVKENIIKKPLTNKEYLNCIMDLYDISELRNIQLSKKFLRISTYDDQITYEPKVGDPHHFGIDFINGETFRSFPLTIAAMIYRLVCNNGAVAPFDKKMVRFKLSEDIEAVKKRFVEIAGNINIDNDLMLNRLRKLSEIELNTRLVEFTSKNTKFMPLQAREAIFSSFYEQDIKGNMTDDFKPNCCDGLTLWDLYNKITMEAHSNPNVGAIHRYKAEVFAGSLLNENNKELLSRV